MSKRPPKKGPGSQQENAALYAAASGAAFLRPTVLSAAAKPTIGVPSAPFQTPSQTPSKAEILAAMQRAAAYFSAGRLLEAEKIARLVLQFLPSEPDALHLLGLIHLGRGEAEEAARLITKAIEVAGPHPSLLVNLGNTKRLAGKFDAAMADYLEARRLDPAYADSYLERAALLLHEDRGPEAIEEMALLVAQHPSRLEYRLKAVALAAEAGDFGAGLALCRDALGRFDPPPPDLMAAAAMALERLSQLDEAILWAERTLVQRPSHAAALRVWAKAQRRAAGGDPEKLKPVRERLEASRPEQMPPKDARIVFGELAGLCDQSGDIPAAFDYFRRQNDETRKAVPGSEASAKAYLEDVEGMIASFTADFVSGWSPLPNRGVERGHRAAPVFLVGFPRSGTTLLDQILDAHPDIQVIEERPLVRALRLAADAMPGGYPGGLSSLSEEDRMHLRGVYWDALSKTGADLAGHVVVDKMPLNLLQAGLIHRVFPEAKFILALRHPVDCVLSCFMQDFVPNGAMANFLTLQDAAHLYDRAMTLWETCRKILPLDICEIRYERIVCDLQNEASRVLAFLGLPWHEAMRDPAAHALSRSTIRTPSYAQVTKPLYRTALGRWRLYETYLQPVLPVLEPHIARLGYASSPA